MDPRGLFRFVLGLALLCLPMASPAAAIPIQEHMLPADASPEGIVTGPDGNLWFTEFDGNRIGRITVRGEVTEFPLPVSNRKPAGITVGADGNLWFTEFEGNRIGRITLLGVITEFEIPSPNSSPFSIAAGRDGNLWFTEFSGNKIGRITPAGVITEFSTGITAGSGPLGIVRGADANLWFTEYNANRLGRITSSGTITEFPFASVGFGSFLLAVGPEGNLWLTQPNANLIGRFHQTTHVYTEFALPVGNTYPGSIVAGPDANLWFTAVDKNSIGRISTNGTVTYFPIPTDFSGAEQIAIGPDGNLWFTEFFGNKIGQILLEQPLVALGTNLTLVEAKTFTGVVASFTDRFRPDDVETFYPETGSVPQTITNTGTIISKVRIIGFEQDRFITEAKVNLELYHPSVSELAVTLIAFPDRLPLFAGWGNGGSNFINTTFDDYAPQSIITGLAPYSGSFRPQTPLLPTIRGRNPFTVWTLEVADKVPGNSGVLSNWSLTVSSYSASSILDQYSVLLDWGDGETTDGWVTLDGNGGYRVNGTKTYARPGQRNITAHIRHTSSSNELAVITSPVTVLNAPLITAGRTINRRPGEFFTGVVASFRDEFPNHAFTQFTATIDWGDRTSSVGALLTNFDDGFGVGGAHTYSSVGIFPITVTVRNDENNITLIASTARVLTNINGFAVLPVGSAPEAIFSGPGGHLWFTQPGTRQLGHIDPATFRVTELDGLNEFSSMPGICSGPDGNLWLTEFTQKQIVRVTTSGEIVQFSTGNFIAPGNIVAGPDNRLWFTARNTNMIGRIDTNGGINNFFLANPNATTVRITSGPGSFLWFTESTGKIGRIDLNGNIVEFIVPTENSQPTGITTGPDGNLWFTETGAGKIGRLTPAGAFTEFPLPRRDSRPKQIITGPDGKLWFTEADTNRLGWITTAGISGEILLPTPNPPSGLASGPDGNIWYTDSAANQVYQLVISPPVKIVGTNFQVTAGSNFTTIVATFIDPAASDWWDTTSTPMLEIPRPIEDFSKSFFPLTVAALPADRVVGGIKVNLSLLHSYISDLALTLIAPDGTRVLLSDRQGGSGQNYVNTTFDDRSAVPIASGTAPFSDAFTPESPLQILNGKNPNGIWKLEINDTFSGDIGQLLEWSLLLGTFSTNTLADRYRATIDWNNGRTSTGSITHNGKGGFNVLGNCQYAEPGIYAVGIELVNLKNFFDLPGRVAATNSTVTVTDGLRLKMILNGEDVVLYWPQSAAGFVLETASSLALGNWQPVPVPPFVIESLKVVIQARAGSNRFYRLRK